MKKALVFLSCGQREGERNVAKQVEAVITQELGMDCYNAESVNGFDDVMFITDMLARADYYVFIDLHRRGDSDDPPISVFTHQEFALARAWGLDKMLAFQEEGLKSHGILHYVLAHPVSFNDRDGLPRLVAEEIRRSKWDPYYSRNLVARGSSKPKDVNYIDGGKAWKEWVWYLGVDNLRKDRPAVDTIAVLHSLRRRGEADLGKSPDKAYLKWAGTSMGYKQTILPEDAGSLDLLATRVNQQGVFLHSARDVFPRRPIIQTTGEYVFTYRFFAQGFPILTVDVLVELLGRATESQPGLGRVEIFTESGVRET